MSLSDLVVKEGSQVSPSDKEYLYKRGLTRKETEIVYPDSDGEPMGETGFYVRATMHLYGSLLNFFCKASDVYVASDMFLYYEEGNPRACKAPDAMVIKGVKKYERRTFKTWEEQAAPCVIFEITSKSTMLEDLVTKSILYATLGVQEYFVFDPLREYLENALVGFCLVGKEYISLQPNDKGFLRNKELGLLLIPEGEILRLIDQQTQQPIPDYVEALAHTEQETQRAEQERRRAEVAEAELARLRVMMETK